MSQRSLDSAIDMVPIRTAEASGAVLQWLVAKTEGRDVVIESVGQQVQDWRAKFPKMDYSHGSPADQILARFTPRLRFRGSHDIHLESVPDYVHDWKHGGALIEREMREHGFDVWSAVPGQPCMATYTRGVPDTYLQGETPLEAAMRCLVDRVLGAVVEVPAELLPAAATTP